MANSVISSLETLFPNTIDFMHKEKSMTSGLMPIVLNSYDMSHLALLLFN